LRQVRPDGGLKSERILTCPVEGGTPGVVVMRELKASEPVIDDSPFLTEPAKKKRWVWIVVSLLVIGLGGTFVLRGSGTLTRVVRIFNPDYRSRAYPPRVALCTPAESEVNVAVDSELLVEIDTHNSVMSAASVSDANVAIFRTGDHVRVPAIVSLGTDKKSISIKPDKPLEFGTNYTLYLGTGLKDERGLSFLPFTASFNTKTKADSSLVFEKVPLPTAVGSGFTCVKMGPGHQLYAASDAGKIFRFAIQADGTLSSPEEFEPLTKPNNGPRLVTGFVFDPASTPENPILWVPNSPAMFTNVPDFSDKLTRISGKNLDKVEDILINLPRSFRDHMTNQPSIGPDGALYIPQGSSSAYGAPDREWGDRAEHLLTAAILRLDVSKLPAKLPLDVKTVDVQGPYDPRVEGAPLTVYATGIRMPYDMVWHSNGQLYSAVNGSSAGGNSPAKEGVPGLNRITLAEHDWLFKIKKGGYYGHPNPTWGYYVLNGGNPTKDFDKFEVPFYPVGIKPEKDWEPAIYDLGAHISADGTIEYKGDAFGGKLKGALMICRYNVGADILTVKLDAKGDVAEAIMGIRGLTGFANPLDIEQDEKSGNLYIADYGAQKLILARPIESNVAATK
jgi:glucose/arabinose dehydrogenase